jgi:CRP/FNR family transcriptional regulator, cyclic AMP receptor protein
MLRKRMEHPLKQHLEEIISTLAEEEFEYILGHYIPLKRKKHQFIVQAGDYVQNDHFVVKGCLKAYLIDEDGKEHIIQFAMENWWITDYYAYINKTKATFFIECIEDCELLAISKENKDKLCAEMHKIEHFSHKKTQQGYLALQKRILSLLRNSAQERYAQLLEQYPQLSQRVPKKMIASYLGVSREILSRLKA